MTVRSALRQAHLWIGLGLSLILLVLAVTGSALVYKDAYWRAAYPELREPLPELSGADHAAAVARAAARFGPDLRSVKLPRPGLPAYHLYLADGEAFLAADDHALIDAWRPGDRLMSTLFDLHAHLMAGEAGERVGGVVGLLAVLLTLTGLVLWWPARRRFSLRALLPRDLSRRILLISHRDLGALAAPLLLVLLLTGSGMVFYEQARTLLNGLFGDTVVEETALPVDAGAHASPPSGALFERAGQRLPDARIVFYYPPREGSGVHGFRLRQPCELHPNGRSYVDLGPGGDVLRVVDACEAAPGDRATHAIYPLHSGKAGSRLYALAVFLGGLALALVSATGAGAYLRKIVGAPKDGKTPRWSTPRPRPHEDGAARPLISPRRHR